jgi:hypothetical protein
MRFMLIFSFLITLCKGSIWMGVGLLLRNHMETIFSLVSRKPHPEGLVDPKDFKSTKGLFNFIGLMCVFIGIGVIILGVTRMIAGFGMPGGHFPLR